MTPRLRRTIAAYRGREALARFAEAVDVITFEFENVPTACVEFLASASRCGRACARSR